MLGYIFGYEIDHLADLNTTTHHRKCEALQKRGEADITQIHSEFVISGTTSADVLTKHDFSQTPTQSVIVGWRHTRTSLVNERRY